MSNKYNFEKRKPTLWPGLDVKASISNIKDNISRFIPHRDVPYNQVISDDDERGLLNEQESHQAVTADANLQNGVMEDQPPSFHSVGGSSGGNRGASMKGRDSWDQKTHRWKHLKDLDHFFIKVYNLWVKGGFLPLILSDMLDLIQFVFIILLGTILLVCVDYQGLFSDKSKLKEDDRQLWDFINFSKLASPPFYLVLLLLFAIPFWIYFVAKALLRALVYLDIRDFYRIALGINPKKMREITWQHVVEQLKRFQQEGGGHALLIKKQEVTNLDVYHRILRFTNFTVALGNRNLLPLRFNFPLLGNKVFCPSMLMKNYKWILFTAPGSLFEPKYRLRDEFHTASREEAIQILNKRISNFAIMNLILAPFIFVYQILYSFFSYADLAKKNPGALGSRHWNAAAKLEFRHFNELDHELNQRLGRAYTPAKKYLQLYTSPVINLLSTHIGFMAGSVLAILLFLGLLNEHVLTTEYLITTISIMGIIVTTARIIVPPEETLCEDPTQLLEQVLKHIHYMPDEWKVNAGNMQIMKVFSQLFQYKVLFILHELVSPIITPVILYFSFKKKSPEIVDFFRRFSVEVEGLGDICSFAQMDLQRHGDPSWLTRENSTSPQPPIPPTNSTDNVTHSAPTHTAFEPRPLVASITGNSEQHLAKNGKTELSLVSFTIRNPSWKPPKSSQFYVKQIRQEASESIMLRSSVSDTKHSFPALESLRSGFGVFNNLSTSGNSQVIEDEASRQILAIHHMHDSQMSFQPTSSMYFGNWPSQIAPPVPLTSLSGSDEITIPEVRSKEALPPSNSLFQPLLDSNDESNSLTQPLISSLNNIALEDPTQSK